MSRILKDLLAQPDRVLRVFALGRMCHPIAIEMFGHAGGFDGLWFDQEHSAITTEQILVGAIAARANGFGSFVRMPFTHYSMASQNLEAGVEGVMAARIASAVEAAEFTRWCCYTPAGWRGMNTQGADGYFTRRSARELADARCNETLIGIQIETLGSLNDVDAIAALPQVDLLFVGPADLSCELGVLGQPDHARVWEAVDVVQAACRKHGKAWGTVPPSPDWATRAVEKGCRMLTIGSELHALRVGIDALKQMYGVA
jgi:2-dehydro-3-deoxyglucarate aldolase/4-hydroxy-2-oxoheptanedioate aldolase